jgi:hypothetical protein
MDLPTLAILFIAVMFIGVLYFMVNKLAEA